MSVASMGQTSPGARPLVRYRLSIETAGLFILGGLFGYFIAFYKIYRDPSQHPRLTPAERAYLAAHGATPEGQLSASRNTTATLCRFATSRGFCRQSRWQERSRYGS